MESVKKRERAAVELDAEKTKRKIGFGKAVFIYLLGGIVGTLWETILNLCCGAGFVYCNGSLFTPFNFVYGTGALVIIACMHNMTKVWQVYLVGFFVGGFVEYTLSFLEEKLLGTRSWNYSDLPLNINGRTTLPYMAFWGLLCVAVIFLVYKPLDKLLDKMPSKAMNIIAIVMCVILVIDMTLTVGAIIRYAARHAGQASITRLGALLDKFCNDAFMQIRFPNLKFA